MAISKGLQKIDPWSYHAFILPMFIKKKPAWDFVRIPNILKYSSHPHLPKLSQSVNCDNSEYN